MFAKIAYPADFPCVVRDTYSFDLDAGVLRDSDVFVFPDQRRAYDNLPGSLSIEFAVGTEQIEDWLTWMNQHGFDWFSLKVAHPWMPPGAYVTDTAIRLISQTFSLDYVNWNTISVKVQAELSPSVFATGYTEPVFIYDWIIAGTPADPSPDWIIAKTPSDPSTDWVVSGVAVGIV